MKTTTILNLRCAGLACAALLVPALVFAAPPVVKTVPWVPTDPLVPHDTYPGKSVRLKGTSDLFGAGITYEWDFGDGSPLATGAVGTLLASYGIEASHVYAGVPGTLWTAKLTVKNSGTAEQTTRNYLVIMRVKSLGVEANIAIDEGLWYLHKNMVRTTISGSPVGYWDFSSQAGSGQPSNDAANVTAFEVNGHRENGAATNPYTETVARGMHRLFTYLVTFTIPNNVVNGSGNFNPDTNGNGYGIGVNAGNPMYQGGQVMDAIVATGTPDAVTSTGNVGAGADPGIFGRTYKSILQDMLDYYVHCQSDGGSGGSWDYGCNQSQDNSAAQWGAIGLIPAEREWGLTIPPVVKTWSLVWLTNSQNATGAFGYRSSSPLWGPFAVTPSGMVQLAMDGKGRGDTRWDKAETLLRENFNNAAADSGSNIKHYYYGMFSFTKSMLLHDSNGDGIAEPITLLRSLNPPTAGNGPIDWYSADPAAPDANNPIGVARKLINDQNAGGYWTQHSTWTSAQWPFETAGPSSC